MKIVRYYLLPLLFVSLALTGCDSTVNEDGSSMVTLFLQPTVAGSPLSADLSTTYDVNGSTITFTSARIYISEIELLRSDGTSVTFEGETITAPAKNENDEDVTHTVTDRIVLARHDAGVHKYELGMAESGDYTGIRYKIGIDGLSNRLDASQVPSSHPLAKQTDKNNHWNWSAGYQFLRMDGMVDTDNDQSPDEVWEIHLGTANFLTEMDQSMSFTLEEDGAVDLHIIVDYAELLSDVDLTNPDERLTHVADNLPMANKVKAMIGGAFTFHGVHESNGSGHSHN